MKALFAPLGMKIAGGLVIAMLVYIGLLHLNLAVERRSAAKWQREAVGWQQALKTTEANYRAASEAARKADRENKLRVEAEQSRINMEVSSDHKKQLADLRARYDALRLRLASGVNTGSPGAEAVPGVPDTTCRADDFSLEDRFLASEQALRLKGLQDWIRSQQAVPR